MRQDKTVEAEPASTMTAGEKIKSFSFSKMISDVKAAAGNLNFIPWYTFYVDGRACFFDVFINGNLFSDHIFSYIIALVTRS